MIRLGVPDDQPLAVQQWQGLIAVNYPARNFGITRFLPLPEAKRLCPELHCQHVATWREGESEWKYREDSNNRIQMEKVSLDPYRLQSRRILAVIKDVLPPPPIQKVEKASIDEVFLDLSTQVHNILLQRYPELRVAPYDDPTENLPLPPSSALDWEADHLVDLDASQTEDDDPDWDDVVMNIGSEIVRAVRRAIKERLKYTCSAGIARNKMMAKLGSGAKKPNQQTIVRNRAIQHFLSSFKFTKIRSLGGKLGDQVVETFNTDELTELLKIPIEHLKSKIGDDTGTWLHGIIRGEDHSEVNSRTQIKSMLSAKSFRPSINDFEQGAKWLRIFVADIYSRLVEEGVTENKRRPKTMNLHHRQGGQTRSKQIPIPQGKKIDQEMLLDLAKTLLGQVIVDGRAWPCANLSLSVGGFEDGVSGNKGIGGFLVKGDEARLVNRIPSRSNNDTQSVAEDRPFKRQRPDDHANIERFFSHDGSVDEGDEEVHLSSSESPRLSSSHNGHHNGASDLQQQGNATYLCRLCNREMPGSERNEHEDWHFAKDLQAGDTHSSPIQADSKPSAPKMQLKVKSATAISRGRGGRPEKGQSRLAFG